MFQDDTDYGIESYELKHLSDAMPLNKKVKKNMGEKKSGKAGENWELIPPFDPNQSFKPFWNPDKPGDQIVGNVSNIRQIEGNFGMQTIADVGDFSVNVSAGIKKLLEHVDDYVRITYEGFAKSNTGRDFKKYKLEVRK